MNKIYKIAAVCSLMYLYSCGTYFNQPFSASQSRTGEFTKSTRGLLDLPPATEPVEVAVYNFSDQTGQYKAVENGSTFSTAVTQGGTTMLIKALEDSGWFIPIERENLSNLSTERNIIRNTKQEYIKNLNPNEPPLPPLLYAGLIIEGGIISYDTNIVTGGIGARYFGLGGSAKYRQDRITVYLRAVSTSNGEILKTVYVSKTILSQALDGSFFRFVKFQRLLEAETGITQNEPVQLAVKDAIEKAVRDLILEGVKDRYWSAQGGIEVNQKLVDSYDEEKRIDENTGLYERLFVERPYKESFSFSGGLALIDGDYEINRPSYLGRIGYQRKLTSHLNWGGALSLFKLDNGEAFTSNFATLDLNAQIDLLPNDNFGPYIFAGPGVGLELGNPKLSNDMENLSTNFLKIQYGGGLNYFISEKLGLKVFAEHNILFNDKLDNLVNGKRDDYYFNFGIGLNYFFGTTGNNNSQTQSK
ncbi:CsgG/HfaB family protein [Christiangramia sp. LLG6405-1]|uniref:CsgG/HfaB family protein n=1 Tax=Christiangramia sp. LLG6405-1 TaxID=3160832 RepID=UPI00386835C6